MMKKVFQAVGVAVTLCAVGFVAVYSYNAGWIHSVVPERPVAAPVSIALHGPKNVIAGEEVYFYAAVTGKHGPLVWTLAPNEDGALKPLPSDEHAARFLSMSDGVFSVQVATAGDAMRAASAHLEFDNIGAAPAEDPPFDEPVAQAQDFAPPPTVGGLVLVAFDAVSSESKSAEAAIVVGCLRALANRLKTGQLAPGADVSAELTDHVEQALGDHAVKWVGFLESMRSIFNQLRLQGDVTTAASAAPTLLEAADALSTVADH